MASLSTHIGLVVGVTLLWFNLPMYRISQGKQLKTDTSRILAQSNINQALPKPRYVGDPPPPGG